MSTNPDPAAMTIDGRLDELSIALATGYLRLLASRRKELEEAPLAEAPCPHVVNEAETTGKESA